MVNDQHFYNETIRKAVAVFGTLFNNIYVVRKSADGAKVLSQQRVPLAYGPRQKFLARLEANPDLSKEIAIKLPRMAFEMTALTYDSTIKLNKMNKVVKDGKSIFTYSPYIINMELSILSKNQDDALQILEQIIPYFQPDYTISVKDLPDMGIVSDMPITLNDISMQDDYEGDFTTRRTLIYTLNFSLKTRFYGPVSQQGLIKTAIVNMTEGTRGEAGDGERITIEISPPEAGPNDPYDCITTIDFIKRDDNGDIIE